jgi:hypothetical protein
MKATHITILNLLLLAYFAMVGMAISGVVIMRDPAQNFMHNQNAATKLMTQLFNGRIEGIDAAASKIILQTDMGLEALPVATPDLMKRFGLGDPVTVELDEQGRVLTIVKTDFTRTPAPDLIN